MDATRSHRTARAPHALAALALLCGCAGAACRASDGADPPIARAILSGSSSDGLVFARVHGDSRDLFRLRLADGAELPLVTSSGRDESWPYWSERAARLLFESVLRGEASDLFLLDPAAGQTQSLTQTQAREEHWPTWAPDGSALAWAFRGGRPGAGIALREFGAGGAGAVANLASAEPPYLFLRPEFSPDGRQLVAQQRRSASDAASDLWIFARDRKEAARLLVSDPNWHDFRAAFTRDGARVVFSRRPGSGGRHSIWSVATAGAAPQPLLAEAAFDQHSARPSPARDELVFSSDRAGNGSHDLFLADLAGGGIRALRESPDQDEYAPRWSPDGERIAAVATARGVVPTLADGDALRETRILVFDRSGRLLRETSGFMPDWMPAWQD